MQLVAYGAQDIYLTGNPQITFFKVVYRRHTNFSMEAIRQTFNGTADFGGSVSATISRNGDLVYRMYLEHEGDIKSADGSDDVAIGCDYGSHLMKEVELEIGGQKIDKHYGHWHSVYSQLTEFNPSGSDTTLFNRMTGNGRGQTNAHSNINGWTFADEGDGSNATGKFWIPLYFWFCRNPGLALPLIALQYHEVKVKITFETMANLSIENHDNDSGDFTTGVQAGATAGDDNTFQLWADYIYLDTDERRRFAQVSHEYLIEQLQFENKSGGTMDLNFNHPVKELIWTGVRSTTPSSAAALNDATDLFQRPKLSDAVTDTFLLKLNGHDRFKERDATYFTRTQIWQHHTGYGSVNEPDAIAVYSFALKPE